MKIIRLVRTERVVATEPGEWGEGHRVFALAKTGAAWPQVVASYLVTAMDGPQELFSDAVRLHARKLAREHDGLLYLSFWPGQSFGWEEAVAGEPIYRLVNPRYTLGLSEPHFDWQEFLHACEASGRPIRQHRDRPDGSIQTLEDDGWETTLVPVPAGKEVGND